MCGLIYMVRQNMIILRYNNSILHCKKGCDFAVGRMNEENTRDEAQIMCKSYANELYAGNIGDLGKKF